MTRTSAHGQYDIREIEHVWIPVAPGVRLSARLWLPVTPEPVPAILEYIPYRKRDMVRARDERNHPVFARHGYGCVRVDMRGSGDSEGLMTDMYIDAERDDILEVMTWIAAQDWCSGAVGMLGTSWGGTAALQAAVRRPPQLKAVIAVCATNNRFDDDIHHMGGCLLTDTVEWGATLPVILASAPDPDNVGPAWRKLWRERLEGLAFPLEHWVAHQTRDDYWRRGSVNETPDAIHCPVLAVGGWADRYSNTVMHLVAQNRAHCWGIVGPWGHHYPDAGAPGPGIDFQRQALRWWDRWLKGIHNGVDDEPRLRVWRLGYDPPQDRMASRSGGWISEVEWPSRDIQPRDLWLQADNTLRDAPAETRSEMIVPDRPRVAAAAGDTGYFGRDGGLPGCQQEDDAHCLVFETAPLSEPLDILGAVRLTLVLRWNQPVATLVARLNDVPPNGGVARVVYAVRNLALNDQGQIPLEPADPNSTLSVTVEFPNIAYRFDAGHRIRLALSGAYWPLIWPAPKPVRITIAAHPAHLTLPVRPAGPADPRMFPAPGEAPQSPARVVQDSALERWIDTDPARKRHTVKWRQPFKRVRFDTIDLEFGYETGASHEINLDDPHHPRSRFDHRLHFKRKDAEIDVIGSATLTSTTTAFEVSGTVEARENGERIFERAWTTIAPRTRS